MIKLYGVYVLNVFWDTCILKGNIIFTKNDDFTQLSINIIKFKSSEVGYYSQSFVVKYNLEAGALYITSVWQIQRVTSQSASLSHLYKTASISKKDILTKH